MMDFLLQPRNIENSDWAAALFIIILGLVALTRSVFEKRFSEFLNLAITNKYLKSYRDNSNLTSWFNIILFTVNLITLAFLIQIVLTHFGYAERFGYVGKSDWILYIRIFTLLAVFITSKYVIEKIIAISFNVEEFSEQFNLQKVSYRTYIGLLITPIVITLYFNNYQSDYILFVLIATILIVNVLIYIILLKNYQNLIINKLFYFILYLCALEIAPYYFMYYWFANS